MRIRSLCRSLHTQHAHFMGDYGRLPRSRKPVWAIPSIEGSNPSLSVSHQVRAFLPHALSEDRLPKLPSQARTSPRLPHSRPFVHSPSIHRAAESSVAVVRKGGGVFLP